MKKIEALNAIDTLQKYVKQNKCFEVYPRKDDRETQSAVIRYLNEAREARQNFLEWADAKIGSLDSGNETLLAEYKVKKKEFDELTTLAAWVACLTYYSE